MLQYQIRPLSRPVEVAEGSRRSSRFSSLWMETLELLERELRHLKASNVVIEVDVGPEGIRNDGRLRSTANPQSPSVILSFDSVHGPLSYPCGTFNHWQANVRAIALSLEALRTVDRYGVAGSGEQYRGWDALPDYSEIRTLHAARELIESIVGTVTWGKEPGQSSALREADFKTHPDRGGDARVFDRVQQARKIILNGK